jgi:acetylornithine deacetylase/succinyl-diaminopimelate desuccinylase-like protein
MWFLLAGCLLLLFSPTLGAGPEPFADDALPLVDRAQHYLVDLIKIDSSGPLGNETKVAEYLRQVTTANGIPNELLGDNPKRLNFVARLKGSGKNKPLLLMAHSDTIPPGDRASWTTDPFGGESKNGYIWGRGSLDDKSLLAAELAVLVEIKTRNLPLSRDVILFSESDEENGASGIQWLIQHAYPKIEAEFALNEGGYNFDSGGVRKVYQVQTAEKIPTRITLTARGAIGPGSLPRPDNPLVRVARAMLRLVDAEQPVRMSPTTRRYLRDIAKLPDYEWVTPLLAKLENAATQAGAANQIHAKSPELEVMIRTSVSPTNFRSGTRFNIIPNSAEALLDVRRLPNETREEVLARFRQQINDPSVEVALAPGPQMPPTTASPLTTALYKAIETVLTRLHPEDLVLPSMSRGSTDGSYLRAQGMPVYGAPLFEIDPADNRYHGLDERIPVKSLQDGTELLWQIVLEVAGGGGATN